VVSSVVQRNANKTTRKQLHKAPGRFTLIAVVALPLGKGAGGVGCLICKLSDSQRKRDPRPPTLGYTAFVKLYITLKW